MLIGCCTTISHYPLLQQLGYSTISLAGKDLVSMSEEEFEAACSVIDGGTLQLCSINAAFPPTLRLNGAGLSLEALETYTRKLCERMERIGATALGVGSPNSRTLAPGFDEAEARAQFAQAMGLVCAVAKSHGITVCLEACCTLETNFINTTSQALKLVRQLDMENFRLVYDIYHAHMMGESVETLTEAYPYVQCVHICKPGQGKRYYPDAACVALYRPYLDELVRRGYGGELSIEAFDGDFSQGVAAAMEVLKEFR